MSSTFDHQVAELIALGYSRRRIAKELETTEWQVRRAISSLLDNKPINRSKNSYPTNPNVRADRSRPFPVVKSSKQSKTQVVIKSTAIESDVPSKIHIRPSSMKLAVVSDIHTPFENVNAVQLAKAYLKDYEPDMIVFLGDVMDLYTVSRYEKNPKIRVDLQGEVDYARNWLRQWVLDFPDADFKYLEGNHEQRQARMLRSKAPALEFLDSLKIEELLGLKGMGIEWIPEFQDLQVGNLMFLHGHMARRYAGSSAKGHFETYGCSLIMGHVHRGSIAYRRNKYGTHCLIENPCLCDFDVEYTRHPDWLLGFTTVEYDGDDFRATTVPIIDYKIVADGKVYVL